MGPKQAHLLYIIRGQSREEQKMQAEPFFFFMVRDSFMVGTITCFRFWSRRCLTLKKCSRGL